MSSHHISDTHNNDSPFVPSDSSLFHLTHATTQVVPLWCFISVLLLLILGVKANETHGLTLALSPDLIRCIYHFQYNLVHDTESDPRWGFASVT